MSRCAMTGPDLISRTLAGLAVAVVLALPAGRVAMAAPQDTLATSKPLGPITLGDQPVHVVLRDGKVESAAAALPKRPPGKTLSLVLKGLSATQQPGVIYHLYLGLPPGAAPRQDDPHYVGTFNFFNAVPLPGVERSGDAASPAYSIEITDLVDTLQRRNLLGQPLSVTIVPGGTPASSAKPVVGEIALVAE